MVLTGGPGAGKTAVLELIRQAFCEHVKVLPESASVVFGGGFPRGQSDALRRSAQRAIFHVQRELEAAFESENAAVLLCDRGTVDGAAYWPGPDTLWSAVRTTRVEELARYDAVIHMRTPEPALYERNHLRIETAREAAMIDARIAIEWNGHPHRSFIEASRDFVVKAKAALDLLRAEVPQCCRRHEIDLGPLARHEGLVAGRS